MDDLHTSFYFNVAFLGSDGHEKMSFSEVSGLEKEIKTEEVTCGGENRFKYKLPLGSSSPNLILKGGVSKIESPLIKWGKSTMESTLSEPIQTKNLQVKLLDASGKCCFQWNFFNAYPVKWQFSDLNSKEGNLLIETAEIAYQRSEFKGT
jgi:phage tail-like protein